MSRDHEPRLRNEGILTAKDKQCDCCDQPATHWLVVSHTHMRGEDDDYSLCQRHLSMAHSNQDRFWTHMRSKEQWLAQKVAL